MCREMDQIYKEGGKIREECGRIQGIAEGLAASEMKKAKETVITLAGMGMPASDIANIIKVSLKIVQDWLPKSVSMAR